MAYTEEGGLGRSDTHKTDIGGGQEGQEKTKHNIINELE